MKAGVLFFVIADVKDFLVREGRLKDNGDCDFSNLEDDLGLASVVEMSLKAHGVDVPDIVDKVLKILPLVISLIGG